MTELEAYREWMSDWLAVNPDDEIDSFSARVAWHVACQWQREKDADICEAAPIDGAFALRDIIRGQASNACGEPGLTEPGKD